MSKTVKTSFILSEHLHRRLKVMCALTNTNMGNFIRIAVEKQIETLKKENNLKCD